jgi:hypothetical protein
MITSDELQLNKLTITGKTKSQDKITEISYSYSIFFNSDNRDKAFADVSLAEELINKRAVKTTALKTGTDGKQILNGGTQHAITI